MVYALERRNEHMTIIIISARADEAVYRDTDTFRCWLFRLGLIGDEFMMARLHPMKRLEGNSAWRHAS